MSSYDFSRRAFIGAALAAAGGCRAFNIGGTSPRRPKPCDRVNLAVIGCGTQAFSTKNDFLADPRVQITVACDPVTDGPLYGYRAQRHGGCAIMKQEVDAYYKNTACRAVNDWREVINDPTVDAVLISTPDHWHALIAIAAMRAGKHVYCQKPMTLSIEEGKLMVQVAKESGVTFQVGNQGRSFSASRIAAELVINGYIGEVKEVELTLPGGSAAAWGHGADTARRPIPAWFTPETWDLWQGPAAHWEKNSFIPGIHEPMTWRWNKRYGGGMISDFTPHALDTVQWALGVSRSGPVAIENFKSWGYQNDREVFSWGGGFSYDIIYASGVVVHAHSSDKGVRRDTTKTGPVMPQQYIGAKGVISTNNSKLELPAFLRKWNEKKDLKASDIHLYKPDNGHNHESDFIDGIYEGRQVCSPCEVGHRTVTVAHLAHICEQLGRTSLKWDPVKECFPKPDPEAEALLKVPYANGWKLA